MSTVPSPEQIKSAQVLFTVKVDGTAIADTVQVVSIDSWAVVNKVPKARVVMYDGSPAKRNFELSSQDTFLPGSKVEITAGYRNQKETLVVSGVIVKQTIEIDQSNASTLVVDITDPALVMTLERRNAFFENVTDSDLIGDLISGNGLSKDVTATTAKYEEIVQYYATDWDLMALRAELNSFVVIVEAGKVTVGKPDTQQTPVLRVEYGESILDLKATMDAASQLTKSAIKSYSWDSATQKVIDSGPGTVTVKEQGNVTSETLSKVFDVKNFPQQTGASIDKSSLQSWSSAELLKSKLSKIRGEVRFQGSAEAKVGKMIELAGLGDRFNGNAYISGVHHSIYDNKWLTTAEIGLSPRWFSSEAPDIAAPETAGQLPPIQGLQTGVVKKVAKDPGGEFRVEVGLPILQDNSQGVWARLSTLYASNKFGTFFYPEVGDEVIVAFINEDPRDPIILGSVFSKKLPPPLTPDAKNDIKAIVTRSKLEITFDDKDKIIEIKTPGGHSIQLDDKDEQIALADSNRNKVTMSKSGITLDSASAIKMTAKQDITISAGGNLKTSAKMNASMEGLQVSHKAKSKFSAEGSATAELKAGGMLTVRGALVKIN